MSAPLVCAILLTRDRPAMARRAVRGFMEQTYEDKRLLIVDASTQLHADEIGDLLEEIGDDAMIEHRIDIVEVHHEHQRGPLKGQQKSIGSLRNYACSAASGHQETKIILHWDDDDYSHPTRIAEQVALLRSSGAEAVGYSEMLFWDTRRATRFEDEPGRAWLYRSTSPKPKPLGTSLCYWRKTWERKPFPEVIQPHNPSVNWGEDYVWCQGLSITTEQFDGVFWHGAPLKYPQMIASIHGGNTSPAYAELEPPAWTRVRQWDAYCRKTMDLK